jgi:hypothetical protein
MSKFKQRCPEGSNEYLSRSLQPPRTKGALGNNDAADPDAKTRRGETPGSVGKHDGASPLHGTRSDSLKSYKEAQVDLQHALQMVQDLIRHGKKIGFAQATRLMTYWRSGGDDLIGSHRKDIDWIDIHGEKRTGIRLDESVFWPNQRHAIPGKLESHRKKFIEGTRARLLSGQLRGPRWEVELKWSAASGNWDFSDLQFALGPCTLNSIARVKITDGTRDGKALDMDAVGRFLPGDKINCKFTAWEIFLTDRYDWQHGNSGVAGLMYAMNFHHLLMYGTYKNPQQILHQLETPYGFKNPDLFRVYARPFDIETKRVELKKPRSPNIDLQTFGSQEFALPFTAILKDFQVQI